MDIHQLRLFLAIYEKGSLSAAADSCRIAVSAVSQHLGNLEARMGTPLFSRMPRGMKPTAAGHRLASHARGILDAVSLAVEDIRSLSGEIEGKITIGMASSVVSVIGGDLLREMNDSYPLVHLTLEGGVSSDHVAKQLKQKMDIALVFNPAANAEMDCEPMLEEQLFCIGDKQLLGATDEPIELDQLLAFPLILPHQGETMRALIGGSGLLRRLESEARYQLNSVQAIREALFAGLGVSIASPQLVAQDRRSPMLSLRPIISPVLSRKLCICEDKSRLATPAREACRPLLKALLKEKIASPHWPNTNPIKTG
nr:LysR family transcriptional regulator [uncultured Cohaesibacter sp.]